MHTLYTVHEKMDLHNFYYVCHIFTPQYLTICAIFAYSLLTEKAMENAVQGLGESVNIKNSLVASKKPLEGEKNWKTENFIYTRGSGAY